MLLDSPLAVADVEGLYADCEFVGWKGNVDYFANPNFPRSLGRLTGEIQGSLSSLGLLAGQVALADAGWDYDTLKQGLRFADKAEALARRDVEIDAADRAVHARADAELGDEAAGRQCRPLGRRARCGVF